MPLYCVDQLYTAVGKMRRPGRELEIRSHAEAKKVKSVTLFTNVYSMSLRKEASLCSEERHRDSEREVEKQS